MPKKSAISLGFEKKIYVVHIKVPCEREGGKKGWLLGWKGWNMITNL